LSAGQGGWASDAFSGRGGMAPRSVSGGAATPQKAVFRLTKALQRRHLTKIAVCAATP
jgi:hypothetical protein